MSLILAKRSLCKDFSDYESLLPTLAMVKNLLECDGDGSVKIGPATNILHALFDADTTAVPPEIPVWFSARDPLGIYSCYKDTQVYYSRKACGSECGLDSVLWKPELDDCLIECIQIAFDGLTGLEGVDPPFYYYYTGPYNTKAEYVLFKDIAELFSAYLADPVDYQLENVLKVIDCLCDLLEQKITIKRIIRKTGLTIDKVSPLKPASPMPV